MNDNPSPTPTVRLTLRENASILVEGPIELIGPDGEKIETKEKFSLCRCGGSQNKPFCDGSHKANDFSSNPC